MSYIEQVVIEDTAPPEHPAAVKEAFARAGLEVEVDPSYGRRSGEVLPWIVLVVVGLPLKGFLEGFGKGFGEAAGRDSYEALKAWRNDVSSARSGAGTGEGSIQISDPEHSNVILSSALPDEAIDALRDLDWNEHRGDYLVWDGTRKIWRDPTKRDG